MQKQSRTIEDWAASVFTDISSSGWTNALKGIWALYMKISASMVLAFTRKRSGTNFISGGTLFFGVLHIQIVAIFSGLTKMNFESSMILWKFSLFYIIMCMYRIIESNRNLRIDDGTPRYSEDDGISILWKPFKATFGRFGILKEEGQNIWWKINLYKFHLFVEPLIIILFGNLVQFLIDPALGSVFIYSGMLSYLLMQSKLNRYYSQRQDRWDAMLLGQMVMKDPETPIDTKSGMIVQQGIIRSDKNFEKWRKQAQEDHQFEVDTGFNATSNAA